MLLTAPAIQGAEAAQQAAQDWQAVHSDPSIQYAPIPPLNIPVPQEPAWLKFLRELLEPIGKALGMSWPTLKWVLLALAVAVVLYAVWRLTEPLRERVRDSAVPADPGWAPDRDAALALLEDADRLAAAGRFDEATHLLLQRSVHHIAATRPDWVHPASTAREIAAIPALPGAARQAFVVIAGRVERSLFALRALDGGDWQAARAAYADFALQRLPLESVA
ncbi:MAG: hypothetical protein JSR28_13025 [Proteobacteria bacterium]|nr:hypothetical protein [Pseudomonadota bacterium]